MRNGMKLACSMALLASVSVLGATGCGAGATPNVKKAFATDQHCTTGPIKAVAQGKGPATVNEARYKDARFYDVVGCGVVQRYVCIPSDGDWACAAY